VLIALHVAATAWQFVRRDGAAPDASGALNAPGTVKAGRYSVPLACMTWRTSLAPSQIILIAT
jgi:hypothetical protein